MLSNTFSMFDPTLSVFNFSFSIIFLVLIMLPLSYWSMSMVMVFFSLFSNFMKKEIDYVISTYSKGLYSFILSVFLSLCLYNFLALFPFIFSCTSHMLVTLPISCCFWIGIILFSWVFSLKNFMAHLIPVGTPLGLVSFMVLVEILSNFIRPIALTFRLTANMMAGHLLMSIIGSALVVLNFSFMFMGAFFQSFLVIMELGVSIIQAYVFSTLLMLYISENSY